MDTQESSTKPPVLDDTNYSIWKEQMRAYISKLDKYAWEAVEDGWTESSSGNSKALNAIICTVDQEQLKHISSCTSAKEAWDTLQIIHEGLLTRVDEKVDCLQGRSDQQFIYKFLLTQRKENEEAYEPEMLSIGPYHYGKSKCQKMEMYKLEYFQHILKRGDKETTKRLILELKKHEKKARNCYSRDANLKQDDDFVEMMLLDGCFVIEFLRNYRMGEEERKKDPVFRMKWLVEILCRDMLLFENQLPFFILDRLFEKTRKNEEKNLIHLAISCLNHCIAGDNIFNEPETAPHLLGLMYDSWCSSFASAKYMIKKDHRNSSLHHYILDFSVVALEESNSNQSQKENVTELEFIKSVSELQEDGIKFCKAIREKKENSTSSEESKSWLDIKFEDGTIKIPTLVVQDHTESLLRNLIAYEEYGIDERYSGKVVSDYTTLMNCLVNSSRDVQTLRHQKIIQNFLGNDEVLSDIFNRIRPNVSLNCPWFSYRKIFEEVNNHCSKRRNRWIADLKKKYFNNPWSITAFVAATVLLVLTLLQTIFSIR